MGNVYIEHRENAKYPLPDYGFAPSEKYPEYKWNDISPEKNDVYDMLRDCLLGYGLDKEHYGTSAWNPMGGNTSGEYGGYQTKLGRG